MKPARSLAARLEKYVDKSGECWLWTAAKNAKGYGICADGLVHRAVYRQYVGEIDSGLYVLHKCDVRNCCNPSHLYLGDQKQNMADMTERGRCGRRGAKPGEAHPMAKITEAQAKDLLERAKRGVSTAVLASEFSLSRNYVQRVISGYRWSHLQSREAR
jgi:hypothetical protein